VLVNVKQILVRIGDFLTVRERAQLRLSCFRLAALFAPPLHVTEAVGGQSDSRYAMRPMRAAKRYLPTTTSQRRISTPNQPHWIPACAVPPPPTDTLQERTAVLTGTHNQYQRTEDDTGESKRSASRSWCAVM
jgi:hypothetical protein